MVVVGMMMAACDDGGDSSGSSSSSTPSTSVPSGDPVTGAAPRLFGLRLSEGEAQVCLLYTSDAADE